MEDLRINNKYNKNGKKKANSSFAAKTIITRKKKKVQGFENMIPLNVAVAKNGKREKAERKIAEVVVLNSQAVRSW